MEISLIILLNNDNNLNIIVIFFKILLKCKKYIKFKKVLYIIYILVIYWYVFINVF